MDAKEFIHQTVTEHPVVLFMKGTAQFPQCGFSGKAIQVLKNAGIKQLVTINVLEDAEVRQAVKDYSNWPTIPEGCPAPAGPPLPSCASLRLSGRRTCPGNWGDRPP